MQINVRESKEGNPNKKSVCQNQFALIKMQELSKVQQEEIHKIKTRLAKVEAGNGNKSAKIKE